VASNTNRGVAGNGVDFQPVPGIKGFLHANVVVNTRYLGKEHPTTEKDIESIYSIDDGSTWQSLTAPSVDSFGNTVTCGTKKVYTTRFNKQTCKLHIHSYTDKYTMSIKSNVSSGLMIAYGNTGDKLTKIENCNTYLSLDGGKTWAEIEKSPQHWFLTINCRAIANYGGIIVLADFMPTMTLKYSSDFGLSWYVILM
jgi:Neuraminidase (sialidase)